MNYPDDARARDVLADLRRSRGLPVVPAEAATWSFKLGRLRPSFPNFSWRKRAIDRHDLHHVLIEQPCNLKGECQVATWEFAAGAYPDLRAQVFCLPLVVAGFVCAPSQTWQTFKAGRRQQSLYNLTIDDQTCMGDLRTHVSAPGRNCNSISGDIAHFATLLGASATIVCVPLLAAALLLV